MPSLNFIANYILLLIVSVITINEAICDDKKWFAKMDAV